MKKLTSILLILVSYGTYAQTLECQLMRDEILTQARQQQQQQADQAALNMQMAQMDPMARARFNLMQGGSQLGNALSQVGQPTFQEKVQIYKQRCE